MNPKHKKQIIRLFTVYRLNTLKPTNVVHAILCFTISVQRMVYQQEYAYVLITFFSRKYFKIVLFVIVFFRVYARNSPAC